MIIKLFDENLIGQPGLSMHINPNINWQRQTEDYDIGIYIDRMCFTAPVDESKINYAWIIEPPIINGENYSYIVRDHQRFKKVFSYNTNISNQINNFCFIPHGGTWLRQEDILLYEKNKHISFIFSNKQWTSYHKMRHRVYNRFKDSDVINFFGTGSTTPITYKIEGLKEYAFSIVIENSIENDYFTEKLIDCFLTGTIPIYCGTKNISNYFDTNGIIMFNGDEDLPDIISQLNMDYYNSKLESIKNNYQIAHKYIHPEHLINELIQ